MRPLTCKVHLVVVVKLLSFAMFACVSSDDKSKEKVEISQPAQATVLPSNPPLPKPKPKVVIYRDIPISVESTEFCQNGFFKWLPWGDSSLDQERSLQSSEKLQLGKRSVELRQSQDPLVIQRRNLTGRIFEEELSHIGYTYPFRSFLIYGPKIDYRSELELDFQAQPLTENQIFVIGQLYRYTDSALTEVILSSPNGKMEELFESFQTTASFQGQDFDSEIRVTVEDGKFKLIQEGATSTNSGYLFLRAKRGVTIPKIKLEISSRRWQEAHPDVIELAIAELQCGEPHCKHANRVQFFDPGQKIPRSKNQIFSTDPNLSLGEGSHIDTTHYTSLGPGGQLTVGLDGIALNRDGHDLVVHFRKGSCEKPSSVKFFTREETKDSWQEMKRVEVKCDHAILNLFDQSIARELKIVNTEAQGSDIIVDIDAVDCRTQR